MEKFLLIGGAKCSGKGLIRGLLDGHPQLFVSPYHEVIIQALYENDHNVLKKKDIQNIREALAKRGKYFALERQFRANKKSLGIHIASKDERQIDIDFDFYAFDKLWVDDLFKKGNEWTSQEVCMAIYKAFSKSLSSLYLKKISKKKYFCALSDGYPNAISGFLKTYPNSKIIYLKRDPIEIVNALIKRIKTPDDNRGNWFTRESLLKKWGTTKFLKTIVQLDDEAKKTLKKFPKQILIIKFSNFFKNIDKEILRIRKFLNISNNISLRNYSYVGYKILNTDGTSPLSAPIDKGHGDLSEKEIRKLKSYLKKIKKKF
jgi:hypothetical protein